MSPTNCASPLTPAVTFPIAIRPPPSTSVKASLKVALASNLGARTEKWLAGQLKLARVTWPFTPGTAADNRNREVRVNPDRSAAARRQLRARKRKPAIEAAAELAIAI